MLSCARCVALALFGIVAPGIAAAADLPAQAPPPTAPAVYVPPAPDWIVTIGLEGRIIPAWPGAADKKLGWSALPLFSIRKEGTPPDFFGPRDSFGFNIINVGGVFQLGPALQFINQRKASDYAELNGLSDVDYAAQLGVFANFWPAPWLRLRGEVRQGIGGETGVTGDVFLDAVVPIGQWTLSAGPRMTLQTTAATSPYFSITQAQAVTATAAQPNLAPLSAYHAGGGFYSYGAGTQVQYTFNQTWAVHAFVEYQRLTDSAADSPLVTQRGSPNQLMYGLGATYSFNMHPLW